jgi:hypothetical protein
VKVEGAWLAWQDGVLPRLARAVYEERDPKNGLLERGRLLVLADALEEAGCCDPAGRSPSVAPRTTAPGTHAQVLDGGVGARPTRPGHPEGCRAGRHGVAAQHGQVAALRREWRGEWRRRTKPQARAACQLCYSNRRADQAAGTGELSNKFETRPGGR